MNKKSIVYLICGIIAITIVVTIAIISIITFLLPSKKCLPKSGSLYVNGKEIPGANVIVYPNYAEIPLTVMLNVLELKVNWTSDTTAEFMCNGQKYLLDLNEISVKKEGTVDNLLIPTPGNSVYVCKALNDDIILDDGTAASVMFFMQNEVFISIDYEKSAVYIAEK